MFCNFQISLLCGMINLEFQICCHSQSFVINYPCRTIAMERVCRDLRLLASYKPEGDLMGMLGNVHPPHAFKLSLIWFSIIALLYPP